MNNNKIPRSYFYRTCKRSYGLWLSRIEGQEEVWEEGVDICVLVSYSKWSIMKTYFSINSPWLWNIWFYFIFWVLGKPQQVNQQAKQGSQKAKMRWKPQVSHRNLISQGACGIRLTVPETPSITAPENTIFPFKPFLLECLWSGEPTEVEAKEIQ